MKTTLKHTARFLHPYPLQRHGSSWRSYRDTSSSFQVEDLERGLESVEALLVSIGAPRLRRNGFVVPELLPKPEHGLYDLLAAEDRDSAPGRYNALLRRLISFERAADARVR